MASNITTNSQALEKQLRKTRKSVLVHALAWVVGPGQLTRSLASVRSYQHHQGDNADCAECAALERQLDLIDTVPQGVVIPKRDVLGDVDKNDLFGGG